MRAKIIRHVKEARLLALSSSCFHCAIKLLGTTSSAQWPRLGLLRTALFVFMRVCARFIKTRVRPHTDADNYLLTG